MKGKKLWKASFVAALGVSVILTVSCGGFSDIGKPCPLKLEESRKNLEALGESARIVEPSLECSISYCIANFYNEKLNGYCTAACEKTEDCPNGYICDKFLNLERIPKEYGDDLVDLLNNKVCIKIPPQPTQ